MAKGNSSETIASAFNDWLEAEVRSSGVEVNTYLDEYNQAIRGLRGGWDHPDNFTVHKHESHVDVRLPQAWETFIMSLEPDMAQEDKDYQSAWLLFTPLMQVSGSWRNQCYVQASDASDYLVRRHSQANGIDTEAVVATRLKVWLPSPDNFADANLTVDELGRQLKNTSVTGRKALERVVERTVLGYDFGEEESVSTHNMQVAQEAWTAFSTDCVILAAKLRKGELAAVPFLEPKSISATPPPKVIYPLAA